MEHMQTLTAPSPSSRLGVVASAVLGAFAGVTPNLPPESTGPRAASAPGGLVKLVVPLLLLAGLALGAWYFLGKPAPTSPIAPLPAATTPPTAAPNLDPALVVKGQAADFFAQATKAFAGLTDAASVEASLPALQGLEASWDKLTSAYTALPETAKGPVMDAIKGQAGGFTAMVEKAQAIAGLSEKAKASLAGVLSRYKAFTGL